MKDKSTLDLANRLNAIMKEQNDMMLREIQLEREFNEIVYELWRRYPNLKDSADLQPIVRSRRKGDNDGRNREA